MTISFKPTNYNSVSPYFIVNGGQRFIDLMKTIFNGTVVRQYDNDKDGTIQHAEVQIDDSIIMISDSTEQYPPVPLVMHVYVSDADDIFKKAIDAGCEIVDTPKIKDGDSDKRGTFKDFVGNLWSVGTQQQTSHTDTTGTSNDTKTSNKCMTKLQIAQAFSGGQFDKCMDYVTDDTIWNTPGEQVLNGKNEIVSFCNKVSAYFNSVTTNFVQENVIENEHCVSINGTAKFSTNDGKQGTVIHSCDVYMFDSTTNDNSLLRVTSYCITEKKPETKE